MGTINLGSTTVNYSFGSIIALVILILAIVLIVVGVTLTPTMILGFIAGLALSRLC